MEQHQLLKSKLPELTDPSKAATLSRDINTNMKAYGFTDAEISSVSDHRIVLLLKDAINYRKMQSSKPNIARKITKPSKPFSSGVKKDKADFDSKARKEKLGRLKKSGNIKDATSIFLDMINKQ